MLGSTLFGNELTWYRPGMSDVNGVLFQTAVWIAVAFFGVYRFFAYIDRRIRLEGWELDLQSRRSTAPGGEGRLMMIVPLVLVSLAPVGASNGAASCAAPRAPLLDGERYVAVRQALARRLPVVRFRRPTGCGRLAAVVAEVARRRMEAFGKRSTASSPGRAVRAGRHWCCNFLGTVLLATVLAAFFVFLFVLCGAPRAVCRGFRSARAGRGLPSSWPSCRRFAGPDVDDPWAEAQRRRAAGISQVR